MTENKEIVDIALGDIYELKKEHPCGHNEWEVVRIGADCKLKCLGCGHIVMIDRIALRKAIKRVIKKIG